MCAEWYALPSLQCFERLATVSNRDKALSKFGFVNLNSDEKRRCAAAKKESPIDRSALASSFQNIAAESANRFLHWFQHAALPCHTLGSAIQGT